MEGRMEGINTKGRKKERKTGWIKGRKKREKAVREKDKKRKEERRKIEKRGMKRSN